jgi:predicted secreted Zn-dependent protease
MRDVKVTLDVAVTLPRWKPPATASADLLKTWQAYSKAVRLHEAGHRAIAERNAREVMAALTPLRGVSCEKLSDDATRAAEQIVADGRARNRTYDIQTKHGQTQGVELGP